MRSIGSAPGVWLDPRARAYPDRDSGSETDGSYCLYNVVGQRLPAIIVPEMDADSGSAGSYAGRPVGRQFVHSVTPDPRSEH